MSIEVIKQALEALEMYLKLDTMDEAHILEVDIAPKAITALLAAIEQAKKQEPVAWMYDFLNSDNRDEVIRDWITQSQDEITRENGFNVRPLYTAPRQWVGLTDEDVLCLWTGDVPRPVMGKNKVLAFAKAIEAKLKEKNDVLRSV